MEHTKIVSAAALNEYADRRESEGVFPELIWLLIDASVNDLTACRIPYGDNVNQPGWDGLVETPNGYRQFVPAKRSYWEIGTGSKPQGKATSDFGKRTKEMTPEEKSESSYVFVTPRTAAAGGWAEPAQRKWKDSRKTLGWFGISILDGQYLEDWLRDFPAIGRWLLKKIGSLSAQSSISTPAEHWELLSSLSSDVTVTNFEKVFLTGRDSPVEQLMKLMRGEITQLLLATESDQDAEDFISAFLQSLDDSTRRKLATTCLFVKDAEAWKSVAGLKIPHVLIANPKVGLDSDDQLLALAKKNLHRVVIPVSGTWSHGNQELVQLRSPSRNALETVLRECGFESAKATELAGAGALSLAALRRHMLGLGSLPPYATWENARILAQAGLFGKWDGGNASDTNAMELLLGKSYGEWVEQARNISLRPEAPLIQRSDIWRMICRGEAWLALGSRISNDDLKKFEQMSLRVLAEKDPKFELPASEHYLASVKNKKLSYSAQLRAGLVESIALIGSRPEALTSCTLGKGESTADLIVRKLLGSADWHLWASLHGEMPLLAEASPLEYMRSIELALEKEQGSLFVQLFALESTDFGGWNYTSGILWGLENLAWNPAYLVRVTLILGGLAKIDPGGRWANRAANSIVDIFLPWHPQTLGSIALKVSAIKALIREYPEIGWKALNGLLPSTHGATTGSHKPTWRKFIPNDWKQEVSPQDYWDQVASYADIATAITLKDHHKLPELIDRLPDLPEPAFKNVLKHLSSETILSLSEETRLPLWESLVDLSNKHRKYAETPWAMAPEHVSQIESVASSLAPKSSHLIERRLFSDRDFDLYDETGDFEDQRKRLDSKRIAAVKKIYLEEGLERLLGFVSEVESPRKVGQALGLYPSQSLDKDLLPRLITESNPSLKAFVGSFVYSRVFSANWSWVDFQLAQQWSINEKIGLLLLAPFSEKVWQRAETLLGEEAHIFWDAVQADPWGMSDRWLVEGASKLITFGRPTEAIDFFYILIHRKLEFPHELAIQALLESVPTLNAAKRVDSHHIQEVIKHLQEKMPDDSDELFNVEWAYLSLLDHRFGGIGPKTIEHRLASNPELYCGAIAAVFRSDKVSDSPKESTPEEARIARNAYQLLNGWSQIPGLDKSGNFDGDKFSEWLAAVKELSFKSGHFRIALSQLGQALTKAPSDPSGLWIHRSIAIALDGKDADSMRDGYRTGLHNSRGVFSPSGGKQERLIAKKYRLQATQASEEDFHRLAETLEGLSKSYIAQAEQDEKSDRFDFE